MNQHAFATLSPIPTRGKIDSFGDFVRQERTKKRLSQVEFAKAAGIAQLTLSNIELGKTNPARLHTKVVLGLAEAMNLPAKTLKNFAKGDSFVWKVIRTCDVCWKPATPPDVRWTQIDSHFCATCGNKLREKCDCGHPIVLEGKFCLNCGKNYDKFGQKRLAVGNQ